MPIEVDADDNGDNSEGINDDNSTYLAKDLLLQIDGRVAQNLDNTKT